ASVAEATNLLVTSTTAGVNACPAQNLKAAISAALILLGTEYLLVEMHPVSHDAVDHALQLRQERLMRTWMAYARPLLIPALQDESGAAADQHTFGDRRQEIDGPAARRQEICGGVDQASGLIEARIVPRSQAEDNEVHG